MRWPNGSASRPSISSSFGPRTGGGGASTYHRGCDFINFSQVRAVASGTVRVVGTPSGWSAGGRQVWIQHDGFFTKSLHLASTNVSNGQRVNEGDLIGTMGRTGTATGVHLHLELTLGSIHYSNSGQIDPVPYLAARITSGSVAGSSSIYAQWGGKSWIVAIQQKLIRLGYDLGPWGADGDPGPATQGAIRDFQSKNGLTVDGVAGPDTNRKMDERLTRPTGRNATSRPTADIQRLIGVTPDGVYGPDTTAAVIVWQRAHGLDADGVWGPQSDAKGFPPVVADAPLDVDGELGALTIKALQRMLGFTGDDVDGDLGPKTISALQALLKVDVDGQLGPVTARALQRSLGVHVDGEIGPDTVKALQTLLNAGGRLTPVAAEPEPEAPAASARTAVYPAAVRGWQVPLSSDRDAGSVISRLIVHHTTNPGDDEPYFKTKNGRSSCPTFYVRANGAVIEMIAPGKRPSATGSANTYSIAIETQNTTTAPAWGISDESHEAIAQIAAWLATYDGKMLDGVRVDFKLDRTHLIGHNEAGVNATACPGPSMRLDWIVDRAKAIQGAQPVPQPEPEPQPDPDTIPVDRSKLQALFDWLKGLLGGSAR